MTIPDWVKEYKEKGTTIRKRGNKYYKYKVHSERVEGKSYPVLVQDEFLGIITEEGFTPAVRKLIDPGQTMVQPLSSIVEVKSNNLTDQKAMKEIYLMKINNEWYFTKLTARQMEILKRNNIGDVNGKLDTDIL